jgi:cytochrome b involved in lipid metabolism
MRKKVKSAFMSFIVLILPVSLVIGQDLKNEQKIKIIVDEGSGKKILVDTVFQNSTMPDSLKLKDGTVVLIKHPGGESGLKHHNGKDHYFVTHSYNGENEGKEYNEVTIISSDSINMKDPDKKGNVYFYSNSDALENKEGAGDRNYHIITRKSHDNGDKSETISITKNISSDDSKSKTLDVYVSDDDKDSEVEKSRYIIAKDGIVVTVEGSDETKIKELASEIETRMGVKK